MNKRKFLFFILVCVIFIIGVLFFLSKNTEEIATIPNEITPLEELTEEQERQTMVSLYFINPETNELIPEARRIDAKNLLENPYKTLVEMLIEKPKNDTLISAIPEGTKVNNAIIKNGTLELDLSSEFIENQPSDLDKVSRSVYSIVNTLTELNDVNAVKILINGEEGKKFNNVDFDLDKLFTR